MADNPAATQFPLLQRLTDLERTPAARRYGEQEYNLDGFRGWVSRLGNAHRRTPWIHIAGTKGKGSTAALTESILRAAGARTGLFTSPHLEHYGQRFRFDGTPWPLDEFGAALERLRPDLTERQAKQLDNTHSLRTVFEVLTALAFIEFAHRCTTAGILEVGLGGRLDCTNIIDPIVSVITPIGMEHTRLLGSTIELIAAEKAGIIKPHRPVVIFEPQTEPQQRAREVAIARAQELGARILQPVPVRIIERRIDGQILEVQWRGRTIRLRLALLGDHQARNLSMAIAAAEAFASAQDITLKEDHLIEGAAQVSWPGRLEVLPGAPALVLDGAHCPLSASALGTALTQLSLGPFTLLWGMQRDKDAARFLAELTAHGLADQIARVVAYEVPGGRGADPETLAQIAREAGFNAETAPTADTAFATARAHGQTTLATGTLYTLAPFAKLHREP
ncbi:hypothetical protein KQI84_18270 [bacterium]|nr:hypothetical protein [bacterium]